jgi:regulator of protease activity HflC (stomatin/prohibitin superfamily)
MIDTSTMGRGADVRARFGFGLVRGAAAVLATALLGAFTSACSYATVGSGEVGVVWTPDGKPRALPEGQWGINAGDVATLYSARSLEHGESLEVLAANGLRITLDTSIRYHIIVPEAVALDHELGSHYYDVLIGPTLRSQARRVVGRYQPEEIYSTQREAIERQVREGVDAAIKGRHVVLEGVLIRNVTLPDSIQAAINDKLRAEQSALKMKYVIAEAEAQGTKELMEAKARAEREKIAALSQADVKRIEGQATDDYVRLVQQHMGDKMLQWEKIEAMKALSASPNTKVLMLGDGAKPVTTVEVK